MPCLRRLSAEAARVSSGVVAAGVLGGWSANAPSLARGSTAGRHHASSPFLLMPHRCVSSSAAAGSGGNSGRDEDGFLAKLRNLYHEFQLSQDRKLDVVAAEESQEGRDRFFEDEQRTDPRHPASSGKKPRNPHPRDSPLISCNPNLCPRSVLFVPGSKPHAMSKIPNLSADCFILDLEDSVGVGSKRQARENIRSFVEGLQKTRRLHRDSQVSGSVNAMLEKRDQTPTTKTSAATASSTSERSEGPATARATADAIAQDGNRCDLYPRLIVRINSPDFDPATAMLDLELVGLLGPAIEGIALPKTTPRTYSLIKDYIHPDHQLWAFFESPKSVIQATAICRQQVYQYAVMGYNDLSMELQLPMASAPSPLDDAASEAAKAALYITAHLPLWQCTAQVLQAARAYNMFVLDAVFNDPTDKAGFRRSVQECKALGLNGKTLIHPSQIEPTNAAYTPSEAELTWAMRIVEAMQKAQGGVATVDGKMVEELHKHQADRVLALHRSIEAETVMRAREAAAAAKDGAADPATGGERAVESGTREPRPTPSRHRPLN